MRPDDAAPDPLPAHVLESLRVIAAQHSRVADDADDLLQDALLEAVREGRADLSQAVNYRWLAGVMRNLGAMTARSAVRRRIRERDWSHDADSQRAPVAEAAAGAEGSAPAEWRKHSGILALPPSLRSVALLALAGHDRAEIAWLLELAPTAMRQRISALRRRLSPIETEIGNVRSADLPLGLIRRALLPVVVATSSAGLHDPDGHLLTVARTRPHIPAIGGNRKAHDGPSNPSALKPTP